MKATFRALLLAAVGAVALSACGGAQTAAGQGVVAAEREEVLKQFDQGVEAYRIGDLNGAFRSFRIAAEQGFAPAQSLLAEMYRKGEGTPKNDAEALKWYRLAAAKGWAYAQYNLGRVYQTGEGSPKSVVEALRWYRLAAEQGLPIAQNNLGAMYHNGEGIPQSSSEALKWYRLAADQGYVLAQLNLGAMYAVGWGVPENHVEAMKWYDLAAAQGEEWSARVKELVRETIYLSPSDLTSIDLASLPDEIRVGGLVQNWKADGLLASFEMTDGKHSITVLFDGIPPDMVALGARAWADGRIDERGRLIATRIQVIRQDPIR